MRLAFLTVGDPQRLTGGYLYHVQLFAGLRDRGIMIDQIVPCAADVQAQIAATDQLATLDPTKYDVLVVDALARGVCAPLIDQWRRVRPVVVLVHQLPSVAEAEPDQIAWEQMLEAPLLRADRLVAVSAHGAATLIARGVAAERIAIAPPGFDRLDASTTRSDRSPLIDQHDARCRVLCVAQWIPRKGITTLVRAWMQHARPNAVLDLIGETNADPQYAVDVQQLIAQAPAGSIAVHGAVSDQALQAAYQAADLFALPSRFEGYGMVYAEALAHGVPVIACNVGPVPDLITSAAGLFVPVDDVLALSKALDQLINDQLLRERLAQGALQRARSLPSWADTAQQWAKVLAEVRLIDR